MPTPIASAASISRMLAGATLLLAATPCSRAADLLTAGKPVALTGTHGRFDFLSMDAPGRRLLAAHTGNASLDVIDLDRQEVVKIIPTGAAQSSASDAKAQRYYVAVSKPPQMAIIDAVKLEVIGKVALPGPADLMAFNPKTGHAYVAHDDAREVWVIDPAKSAIAATIELPGDAPEDLAFDSANGRLFQCVKTTSTLAVVDVATHKVTANWPTAPAQSPHGMAAVAASEALLIAGGNGELVLMSQKDGKILASAAIAKGVDQIGYDAETHRVYCASSAGKLSVLGVEKDKLTPLGEVATSAGAKSVAIDPRTHNVWIAYAKGEASFVQAFSPGK